MPRVLASLGQLLAGGFLVGLIACDTTVMDIPEGAQGVSRFVTPQVARHLDAEGHFVFSHRTSRPDDSEITEQQASQLAEDWVTRYVHLDMDFLEQGHGAPVDVNQLKPCGRTLYAQSPFVPDSSLEPPVRRAHGSWWITVLCAGQSPEIWLAVSALNGGLWREFHEGKAPENNFGGRYVWRGIPNEDVEQVLVSPEQAVAQVHAVTGEIVSRVPELVLGAAGVTWSVWRVETGSPALVRIKETDTSITTSTFFVGRIFDIVTRTVRAPEPAVAVADAQQPTSIPMASVKLGRGAAVRASVSLRLKDGAPVRLLVVSRP